MANLIRANRTQADNLRTLKPMLGMGKMVPITSLNEAYKELGWYVAKERLMTAQGELTDTYATIRLQPQPDGTMKRFILGDKLSNQYQVQQNADSITAMTPLIQAGLEPVLAGSIDDGKRICIVARFGDSLEIGEGDVYDRYVVYSNEHTGKERGAFMLYSVRLTCKNGAVGCRKDAQLRFLHKGDPNEAVRIAVKCLSLADAQFLHFGESMEQLMGKGIKTADIRNYVKKVFFPKVRTVEEENDNREKIDDVRNQLERLFISGPGADMPGAKGTVYGLYQAANHYLNHDIRSRNRQASFIWGANAQTDTRALEAARELVLAK